MPSPNKNRSISVGDFFDRHAEVLKLSLVGSSVGLDRIIKEATINRPGLALSGFYEYFAEKRIQVMGSAELAYLKSLTQAEFRNRIRVLCRQPIPCLVISRKAKPPRILIEEAAQAGIATFVTPMITKEFINAATISLETEFAPSTSEYGSMVDIMGVGTMVRGSSGIGKSECVLGLIERGYCLVSDDMTRLRAIEGRDLIGTSPELTRYHMEVRGLGIINVTAMFGIGSVRVEKHLDLVVTLKEWQDVEEVDRIGLDQEYYEILDISVPHVTIPVRTGRDLARLVEVAALDQKLKSMGQNSAAKFNERLLKLMEPKMETK